MTSRPPQRTVQSRVFIIEWTAGPGNVPVYQGYARAGAISWPQGDVTPVRVPDDGQYGAFNIVDEIVGQEGLPSLPIQFLMDQNLSDILRIVRNKCPLDLQIHFGVCKTPTDFDFGFDKAYILEFARPTEYGTDDLGALDGSEDAAIHEDVPFTGRDLYEVKQLVANALAEAEVTDQVVDVAICDSKTCGECGLPSDGCQIMFALTGPVAGSPGLPSELLYSLDGGATWAATNITTLGLAEAASAMACVGSNLVVVSNATDSLHYAPIADILTGTEVWTEVGNGWVPNTGGNAIFSLGRTFTWIVSDNGYIYFSSDITAGVEVQSAGAVTNENLSSVHGADRDHLAAVGENNAFVFTNNGGETWGATLGPSPAIDLLVVSFRPDASTDEIWVGSADGDLDYTLDAGDDEWTEKAIPGASTAVRDISWSTHSVGYLASDIAGPAGRILRTYNGGNSWVVVPEATGQTFPANQQVTAIAACEDDANVVLGGGLAANGTDGFLVKAA